MIRAKRIAARGWLHRFLSAATFGYYPRADTPYVVQADVECRILAVASSSLRAATNPADVAWRTVSSADGILRIVAVASNSLMVTTDPANVAWRTVASDDGDLRIVAVADSALWAATDADLEI
jgi:hypothetical protein